MFEIVIPAKYVPLFFVPVALFLLYLLYLKCRYGGKCTTGHGGDGGFSSGSGISYGCGCCGDGGGGD